MPRFSRRALLALVVCPMILLSASLMPRIVDADPPCPYTAFRQTSVHTGYGLTCTDATNSLLSQVQAEAADDCSFGNGSVITSSLVITSACQAYSSTEVQVSGYLRYRCMYCEL